jgi:ethanolaminephosphotransferase
MKPNAPTPKTDSNSHGIDSLNCTLASLLETAAVGYGSTKIGAFTALIPVLPMFFSTWETYHTHTLYLGYFNGPTGRSPCPSTRDVSNKLQRD